tara:strand:- start:2896 stop:4122 length:1227 start_codon:yes stop_codon:yes gene_type:complete
MHPDLKTITPLIPSLITVFFAYIGFSITVPIITDISMHMNQDVRYQWLTILMSAYPIGAILGATLVGSVSDVIGRKSTLLASLGVSGVLYLLTGLCIVYSEWLILGIIRITQGLIDANMVIAQRTIADVLPQNRHSRFFSYLYSFPATAFIIGPLTLAYCLPEVMVNEWHYFWPFMIQACLMGLSFLIIQTTFTDTKQIKSNRTIQQDLWQFITALRHHSTYRSITISNCLLFFVYRGFLSFYPIYIADYFSANLTLNSHIISWIASGSLVTYLFINPTLSKRFSETKIIITCSCLLSFCLLITSYTTSLNYASWLLMLDSILVTIWIPSCLSLISKHNINQDYGKAFGQNQSIKIFSGLVVNLVFPLMLMSHKQLPLICLSLASICVAAMMSMIAAQECLTSSGIRT